MKNLTENEVIKLVNSIKGEEAMKQYGSHRRFLLAGLDGPEEMKSRLAFVDAYKTELDLIHEKLKAAYNIGPEDDEFGYLNNPTFRSGAGKEQNRIIDLMKDYMAFQTVTGRLSKNKYDEMIVSGPDTDEEKDFRQTLPGKDELNFLIEGSAYQDNKKEGIRACRKWMYRNCEKSGPFNLTGTKRNYIDSFGKMPVEQQVNAIFQVETRYYKYDDEQGLGEESAASDSFVPTLDEFKEFMNRSSLNVIAKAKGDSIFWSRLERAVDKTKDRADIIGERYARKKAEVEENSKKTGSVALKVRQQIAHDKYMMKKSKEIFESFIKIRNEYMTCLSKYQEKNDRKTLDALKKKGLEIQNLWKDENRRKIYQQAEGDTKAFSGFVEFTKKLENVDKMNDKTIKKIAAEQKIEKIEKYIGYRWYAATFWSSATTANNYLKFARETAVDKAISTGFQRTGVIISAYTTVKNSIMSVVSYKRKQRAKSIKSTLKEDFKSYNKAETEKFGDRNKRAGALAKITKKRNMGKAKMYALTAAFALGATILGVVTAVTAPVSMPLTITGLAVSTAGFALNKGLSIRRNDVLDKKEIDSAAKLDEKYKTKLDENGKKTMRYIESKVEDRRKILEEKRKRFDNGRTELKILDSHLEKPKKLKATVRTNYAVKKGCSTVSSFNAKLDRELVEEAFRHIFLKDPEGPINEENLIKKEEFSKYVSKHAADYEEVHQSYKEAKLRVQFKELLEADGVKIKVPKNVGAAKKMFHEKAKSKEI